MEKSESVKNIGKALMLFHVKVDTIKKDARNPFFKNSYASLPNILEAINMPLQESGLVFSQFPTNGNALTSILIHPDSGEFMQDTFDVHPVPDYLKEKSTDGVITWRGESYISPQAIGSALTYGRRYALSAILGLNIDDDDDGNAASKASEKQSIGPTNELPWLNEGTKEFNSAVAKLKAGTTSIEKIKTVMRISKATETKLIEASKK